MAEQEVHHDDASSGGRRSNSRTFVIAIIVVLIALAFILYVGGFTKGRESAEEADVETAVWIGESIQG